MSLEFGVIWELYWYVNVVEWVYVMEGRIWIIFISFEGKVEIVDVDKGGFWYFFWGWGYSIEGIGFDIVKFLLVFNDGIFFEGVIFSVIDWFFYISIVWVEENLGWMVVQVV